MVVWRSSERLGAGGGGGGGVGAAIDLPSHDGGFGAADEEQPVTARCAVGRSCELFASALLERQIF